MMTESLKLQPKDRDYNKNGGKREARFESNGRGICYTLRTTSEVYVIIAELH